MFFRFDKGQNHEILCKATREQTRAAEVARGQPRHDGRRVHQVGQVPEHRRATGAHGEGTCAELLCVQHNITSFKVIIVLINTTLSYTNKTCLCCMDLHVLKLPLLSADTEG